MFDECDKKPAGLYVPSIENEAPPSCDNVEQELALTDMKYLNQNGAKYEEELKAVTGMDDSEVFRKRMFTEKPFVDLVEFMLEDTLFNLMEEATYEEFDLTQAPRIYIRKEDIQKESTEENR